MRNLSIVVIALLFVCAAAFAQEKPNTLHVFITNPGVGWSSGGGTDWQGVLGVGLQRMFTPHVSAEVDVSRERRIVGFTQFDSSGRPFSGGRLKTMAPVDVTTNYHFLTDGPWKPYVGLAARLNEGAARAGVSGGVVWQFRPSLGLRFDGKLLGNTHSRSDDAFKGSVGLSWRF